MIIIGIRVGGRSDWNNWNNWRWFDVDLGPCSRGDWRGVIRLSGLRVEALLPWGVVRVASLGVPRPQECESFLANTCIDCTVELDVISCGVTSLKVSEPVKVDSTLHSVFKGGGRSGSGALDEDTCSTAVGEGLAGGDLPVVVGSGLGALGEGASSVGNLVAGQG
jgi:hypothetical protein